MFYWNQNRSTFRTGEPDSHRNARYVIANILRRQGFAIYFGAKEEGFRLPTIYPELDRSKQYTVDIYAIDSTGDTRYIEVDGDIHRSSQIRINKTKAKHENIKECLKIVLIHLTPEDCVGKYALSDVDIWFQIERQHWKGQRQLIIETFKYR